MPTATPTISSIPTIPTASNEAYNALIDYIPAEVNVAYESTSVLSRGTVATAP